MGAARLSHGFGCFRFAAWQSSMCVGQDCVGEAPTCDFWVFRRTEGLLGSWRPGSAPHEHTLHVNMLALGVAIPATRAVCVCDDSCAAVHELPRGGDGAWRKLI